MNSIIENHYPLFEMYQSLRNKLMTILNDEDLLFQLGGQNLALGALCQEIGEVQQAYIDSFKSFTQEFSYRYPKPEIQNSVDKLSSWFDSLDSELKATIGRLSEDDIQNRLIDRGGDFKISPRFQLEVYKEALLIFYGKSSIYLKALEKSLPEQWIHWIS